MFALISPLENNRILEVKEKAFPVAYPLIWMDCPTSADSSWEYTGKDFIPPKIEPVLVNTIPRVVSMRQARLALLANNDLQKVDTIIKGSPEAVQIEWEYASTVDRDSDLVKGLAVVLGYSETMLDQLFSRAASL